VIKIGGSTLGSHDTTIEDIVHLQRQGEALIVVHGGGKFITEWLGRQGVEARFVRGERVTDKATLEVVVSVLAGLVNKEIVAGIQQKGGQAIGLAGVDGGIIQSCQKSEDLGFVGDILKIDTGLLKTILESGFVPVIAPIGLAIIDRTEQVPGFLNINADIVAGEIAAAVKADRLVFLTDVTGVSDKDGNVLNQLDLDAAQALIDSGTASGGMIPKIKSCLKAAAQGSTAYVVDGRQPHALLQAMEGQAGGTLIRSNIK
jgi:acetylglutamate kinase